MALVDLSSVVHSLVQYDYLTSRADEGAPVLQSFETGEGKRAIRVIRKEDFGPIGWFLPSCWMGAMDLAEVRSIVQTAVGLLKRKTLPVHFAYDFHQSVLRLNGRITRYNREQGTNIQHVAMKMIFTQGGCAAVPIPTPTRGIENPGNKCYFNATLMAMCASLGLRKRISSERGEISLALKMVLYELEKKTDVSLSHSDAPLNRLISLLSEIFSPVAGVSGIKALFRGKNPFKTSGQQDAHELALLLLDVALRGSNIFQYREIVSRRSNRLQNVFIPSIDCKALNYPGAVIESQNILPIRLPQEEGKIVSLQTFFFEGVVFKEDVEHAAICGHERNRGLSHAQRREVAAVSTLSVFYKLTFYNRLPEVLPVHLERFSTKYKHGKSGQKVLAKVKKNSTPVDIPYKLIIECVGKGRYEYVLKSVVVHIGLTINSGHYVTYIPDHQCLNCSGRPEKWTRHSDSHTSLVKWGEARKSIEKGAYIIFYDRREFLQPIKCE